MVFNEAAAAKISRFSCGCILSLVLVELSLVEFDGFQMETTNCILYCF